MSGAAVQAGVITFELPGALRPYAGGLATVACEDAGATVGEALHTLHRLHPGVVERVLDEPGDVRRHVNVFVDGENIRFLDGLRTPLPAAATITILAAVSGG